MSRAVMKEHTPHTLIVWPAVCVDLYIDSMCRWQSRPLRLRRKRATASSPLPSRCVPPSCLLRACLLASADSCSFLPRGGPLSC